MGNTTDESLLKSPLVGQILVAIISLQLFQVIYIHWNLNYGCDCPFGQLVPSSSPSSSHRPLTTPRKLLNELAKFQGRTVPFADDVIETPSYALNSVRSSTTEDLGGRISGASAMGDSATSIGTGNMYSSPSIVSASPRGSNLGSKQHRDIDKIELNIEGPFVVANRFQENYVNSEVVRNAKHPEYTFQISERDLQQLRELPPPRVQQMSLKRFIIQTHPRGIGVILGVGRNPLCLELLAEWNTSPGLYIVDPFVHIWKGYDDAASNVDDIEHQRIFEDLRNKIHHFQPRYD